MKKTKLTGPRLKSSHHSSLFAARQIKDLVTEIRAIVQFGRRTASYTVDAIMLATYWRVGRAIVVREKNADWDDETARQLILELSRLLTPDLGKGFSRSNLFNMRRFYLLYPDFTTVQTPSGHAATPGVQTPSGQQDLLPGTQGVTLSHQLSWSIYCELLKIDNPRERSFYEQECIAAGWSVRELRRQHESALFERLALSKDKKGIVRLARKGQIVEDDADIIKNPYVLEFLGIPEQHRYTEKQLEQRLIDNLQSFLLELGKGFAFVARQFRMTINNRHYRTDLVFYHRILKCFVLIDLKIKDIGHDDIGQMNMYLNYFNTEQNMKDDNEPVGIILARHHDQVLVEYATGGLSRRLFVSKYQLHLPDKKQLEARVRWILGKDGAEPSG
jgi:predicted nuclease of restriction endonuclease-like (RecB) superfamily